MTLDELSAWGDPKPKANERPEQTRLTWQEITDALRELQGRRNADQPQPITSESPSPSPG
jgi:hypothetical protein